MYSLCALLGRTDDLEDRSAVHPRPPVIIGLEQGFSMIPLSEAWLQQVQGATSSDDPQVGVWPADVVFEFLTPPVEHWIRGLSNGTAVAYVETEYFSGEGFERAAVWRDGAMVLGPLDGAGAINRALRFLGVDAEPGREEFAVVGLGRHRSLDEWLSEVPRRPNRGGELNRSV